MAYQSLITNMLMLLLLAAPSVRFCANLRRGNPALPQWQPGDAPPMTQGFDDLQPPPLIGLLPSLTPGPVDSTLSPITQPDTILTPLLTPDSPENSPAGVGYRPADLSSFLPESLLNAGHPPAAPPHIPTSASMLKDTDEEFLRLCATSPASELLIDPLGLITEVLQGDLERFLAFHAEEARFPLYIIVLRSDEKLPTGEDLNDLASGGVAKRQGAVLAYPIAEPWRARLFLPKLAHDAASDSFLRELVEACVTEATSSPEVDEQIHRFCVELSTRLFWLEKLCPSPLASSKPVIAGPHLQEVIGPNAAAPGLISTAAPVPVGDPVLRWIVFILCLLAALGVTAWHTRRTWERYKARQKRTVAWILPERDLPQRLGGAFSGGTGAWAKFR
jgi:hypothetical protein